MDVVKFIMYAATTVFGFIFLNYGLYNIFVTMFERPQMILVIGWGAIVIICIFYFGIIKDTGEETESYDEIEDEHEWYS